MTKKHKAVEKHHAAPPVKKAKRRHVAQPEVEDLLGAPDAEPMGSDPAFMDQAPATPSPVSPPSPAPPRGIMRYPGETALAYKQRQDREWQGK